MRGSGSDAFTSIKQRYIFYDSPRNVHPGWLSPSLTRNSGPEDCVTDEPTHKTALVPERKQDRNKSRKEGEETDKVTNTRISSQITIMYSQLTYHGTRKTFFRVMLRLFIYYLFTIFVLLLIHKIHSTFLGTFWIFYINNLILRPFFHVF